MAWQWQGDGNSMNMMSGVGPEMAGFMGGGFMTDSATGEKIPYSAWKEREDRRYREGAEAKRVADLKAQGLMPDGSPIRPEYQTLLDPTTGMLKDQYQMNQASLDPSKMEGYSKYKSQALSDGPSPWASMMLEKQAVDEAQRKSGAAASAASGMAAARTGLGMRGGLSMGARERIATGGARNLMTARQNVANAGVGERFGINTQDQQNRTSMLGTLMNSEQDIGKFNTTLEGKQKEFNILRSLEEKRAKDTQDLTVYQEQMKKWAANKQADATASSGGGGGK